MCTMRRPQSVPLVVGVRQLRDNLKRCLQVVRDGGEVTITERGRAIAKLVSNEGSSKLDDLIARGIVRPPLRRKRPAGQYPEPLKTRGTVSDLVKEQRR